MSCVFCSDALNDEHCLNVSVLCLQIFVRKLKRAYGKTEWSAVERLKENKPTYKLDHIIKER